MLIENESNRFGRAVWKVGIIPDRTDPELRLEAGGDVVRALMAYLLSLLRTLAGFTSQTLGIGINYIYTPLSPGLDPKDRLAIYITIHSSSSTLLKALCLHIENSPLHKFYGLDRVPDISTPKMDLKAECEIVVRESAVYPPFETDFNSDLPPMYYLRFPLIPKDDNDYLLLDSALHHLTEKVVLSLYVTPKDTSKEKTALARYLGRLETINRLPDDDLISDSLFDLSDESTSTFSHRGFRIPLVKTKDRTADQVLHSNRSLRESLDSAHLSFRVRIQADTQETALFIASIVAECGLDDGSYSIVFGDQEISGNGDSDQNSCDAKEAILQISAGSVLEKSFPDWYSDIGGLSTIATPDELLGLFRLPIGSRNSLRCLRMNTDPPNPPPEMMMVLGIDIEGGI